MTRKLWDLEERGIRVAFAEAMMAIIDYSAIGGIQAELIDK